MTGRKKRASKSASASGRLSAKAGPKRRGAAIRAGPKKKTTHSNPKSRAKSSTIKTRAKSSSTARSSSAARSPARAYIWFVRHGQAEGNERHIFNGNRIDAPLSARGRVQANYFALHFPFRPDAILSSPLKRAMQTALPLAARFGMEIVPLPDAEEQDYGELSGKSREQLLTPRYRRYFHFTSNEQMYTVHAPWGEDWEDLKKRAARCLRGLDKHYAGRRVVVISHSDFINCAYGVRNRMENRQTWRRRDVANCGIVRL
ncbi:2,3-bisphosphoglycerate-dependent phosphoglycerate mutase [uncultured archaeon]|nr:2,3-bisphosphoglycerate-dependent phosphoglycerate mutase [uncultured archaeon]